MPLSSQNFNWISQADTQTVIDFSSYLKNNPDAQSFSTLNEVVGGEGITTKMPDAYESYISSDGVVINFKTAQTSSTNGATTSIVSKNIKSVDNQFISELSGVVFALKMGEAVRNALNAFGIFITDNVIRDREITKALEDMARRSGKNPDEIRNSSTYMLCETISGHTYTFIRADVLNDIAEAIKNIGLAKSAVGYEYDNYADDEIMLTDGATPHTMSSTSAIMSALGGVGFNRGTFAHPDDVDDMIALAVQNTPDCHFAYAVYRTDLRDGVSIYCGVIQHPENYKAYKWNRVATTNRFQIQGQRISDNEWERVVFIGTSADIPSWGGARVYTDRTASVEAWNKFGHKDEERNSFSVGNICARVIEIPPPSYVDYIGDPLKDVGSLAEQFPQWVANQLLQNGIQVGAGLSLGLVEIPFYTLQSNPVPLPSLSPALQTGAQAGDVTPPDPNPIPEPQPEDVPPIKDDDPNPPEPQPQPEPTPTPTPTPVPVITTASKLFTVHDLTQTEVDALGGYLWGSNFIGQITSMFSQPSDAIIGLHVLHYAGSLPLGSNETLKLGSVPAIGCTGTRITNQYMSFSCGSVTIAEHYGNVEDYEPYTSAQIFLPYIGFRTISANEIMGATVELKYTIDIYTGICLAQLFATKNGIKQELYNFEGSCGVQLPITGANYSQIVGSLLKTAIGVATGNPIAQANGVRELASSKIQYTRSGSFTASHGACGNQVPFILLERPVAYNPDSYANYYGVPSNTTVTLNKCLGYTRVKDIFVNNIKCTDIEKAEIKTLLQQGVIL